MSNLSTIISYEYSTDIKNKSFWIVSIVMPIVLIGFGAFVGYLSHDSETMRTLASPTVPKDEISGAQIIGMLTGMFLVLFIMMFGAQIFNKVKQEKTNRIAEILVSSVPGRTLVTAKIISVGLLGLTQMTIWGIMLGGGFILLLFAIPGFWAETVVPLESIWYAICAILYFIGGYVIYGSLYAICGAITDKNGENQEYMTIITFLLLASFYISMFAIDNPTSTLTQWCNYIPITSPGVAVVASISGDMAWWQTCLSLAILYSTAATCLILAGKVYTSGMLLMGKKLSPKDFLVFMKSK